MTSVLTQDVFKGLPPEFKWAVMAKSGNVYVLLAKPGRSENDWRYDWSLGYEQIDRRKDPTGWQDSLIERHCGMTSVLTQDVFKDEPVGYNWAALDSDGRVYFYKGKPVLGHTAWRRTCDESVRFGGVFDSARWQDSLIERQCGNWKNRQVPCTLPAGHEGPCLLSVAQERCNKHEHWQYPCCLEAGHAGECMVAAPDLGEAEGLGGSEVLGRKIIADEIRARRKARRKADAKAYRKLVYRLQDMIDGEYWTEAKLLTLLKGLPL